MESGSGLLDEDVVSVGLEDVHWSIVRVSYLLFLARVGREAWKVKGLKDVV